MDPNLAAKEIDTRIEKHKQCSNSLALAMAMTIEAAVSVEELNKADEVEKMEEVLKGFIKLEIDITRQIAALAHLKKSLNKVLESRKGDLGEMLLRYKDDSEIPEATIKNHAQYREFKLKVWHVHHPNEALPEDDNSEFVLISHSRDDFNCPLTKKTLEKPLKNRNCGHYYSKKAIYTFLQQQAQQRKSCPVAGCSAQVSKETLEADEDMERRIQRMQRKQQTETQQEGEEEDVVDL